MSDHPSDHPAPAATGGARRAFPLAAFCLHCLPHQTVHRFIPDPFGPEETVLLDAAQLIAVKKIVRATLRLAPATPVIVAEVACADAACPLVETVIAVFPAGEPPRRWRLTRPRAALTRTMLAQTLATPPEPPAQPVRAVGLV